MGYFWFHGTKDSIHSSHLSILVDKCLLCLKGRSQNLEALQNCRNSKQTCIALWLWKLISVTRSSLASLAHFCSVCRWCGIPCQHYLSTRSLLTQLPLWAIVENVKNSTIIALFHQLMGFTVLVQKNIPVLTPSLAQRYCWQSLSILCSKNIERSLPSQGNTREQQTFISIYSVTLFKCCPPLHLSLRARVVVFHPLDFLLICEWTFRLWRWSLWKNKDKRKSYIKEKETIIVIKNSFNPLFIFLSML